MSVCIKVWDEYDLDLSLYPSFTYPFYIRTGRRRYVKVYGVLHGMTIYQSGEEVCCDNCGTSLLRALTGAWFNPHILVSRIEKSVFREIILDLLEKYPGLGIAIDPWDPVGVFYSVYLSQNTRFHTIVCRWMKKLFKVADNDYKLVSVSPRIAGTSYQLELLDRTRDLLPQIIHAVMKLPVYDARKRLLYVKNVGPKIAHAYLMFSRGSTYLPPVDRHLKRFVKEVLNINLEMPCRPLCIRYSCPECPLREKCIVSVLQREIGVMAGWLQTATYVLGQQMSKGT